MRALGTRAQPYMLYLHDFLGSSQRSCKVGVFVSLDTKVDAQGDEVPGWEGADPGLGHESYSKAPKSSGFSSQENLQVLPSVSTYGSVPADSLPPS